MLNWTYFYNCSDSRALIGQFSLSISGQTHEFIIYAMRQRARRGVDNLTICYCKKQIDVSFSCVCPVIDNEFRQHWQSSLWIHSAIHSHFDNVMTKFMNNSRTNA